MTARVRLVRGRAVLAVVAVLVMGVAIAAIVIVTVVRPVRQTPVTPLPLRAGGQISLPGTPTTGSWSRSSPHTT